MVFAQKMWTKIKWDEDGPIELKAKLLVNYK
jgi:hypothetical protein